MYEDYKMNIVDASLVFLVVMCATLSSLIYLYVRPPRRWISKDSSDIEYLRNLKLGSIIP